MQDTKLFEIYAAARQVQIRRDIDQKLVRRMLVHEKFRARSEEIKELRESEAFQQALQEALMADDIYRDTANGIAAQNPTLAAEYEAKEELIEKAWSKCNGRPRNLLRRLAQAEREQAELIREERRQEALDYYRSLDLAAILEDQFASYLEIIDTAVVEYLSFGCLLIETSHQYNWRSRKWKDVEEITTRNIGQFVSRLQDQLLSSGELAYLVSNYAYLGAYICEQIKDRDPQLKAWDEEFPEITQRLLADIASDGVEWRLARAVEAAFPEDRIYECIGQNARYESVINSVKKRRERERQIRNAVLRQIPDNYIDLFPLARNMKRHFVIHIGPTNSGKTYGAMQALREADRGIYLAPLRLLAYEQFERLNMEGYRCDLVTGEEIQEIPGATFQASTIEMLKMEDYYDVAVIDEAQMIADPERGGSWTAAILGICAETVHICTAPHAEQILIRLIEMCGDTWETDYRQRMTDLIIEKEEFNFPDDVRKGDALIVFSKRNVYAAAGELQRRGVTCSVIYGALPYDVRHKEAEKFAEGENEVVVATDAIGMGLNLPIQRIVFLEMSKYDGIEVRPLKPSEAQQIAGRAGRKGIFEKGFVNTDTEPELLHELLKSAPDQIEDAVIKFPETLLDIDAKVSEIMERWISVTAKPGFVLATSQREIELAKELERKSQDKKLIYDFITLPYDERNEDMHDLWMRLFSIERNQRDTNVTAFLPEIIGEVTDRDRLQEAEKAYAVCDLLYQYARKFVKPGRDVILERKREISDKITTFLAAQKLAARTCRRCGKRLPWNYKFGVCQHCFDIERGRGRNHSRDGRGHRGGRGNRKRR